MMRQQINLYLPEFRVRKDPLTVALMTRMLVLVLVVMVLLSGYQQWTRYQLNSELAGLRVQLEEESRRTTEMENALSRRSESADLRARLEAAEERLASSRQVREFLGRTQLGNVTGFSEYLKDLSRASVEGLSLTEFSFARGGEAVTLRGMAKYSALVPGFVSKIENGRSGLRDSRFSIETSRDSAEAEDYLFTLSTEQ